ncbi:MAG: PEP-CTERM sorting domain-containing protein [Phycisphaerae bacterium]|nr:PEP-CTERM sorting domain-containing protein [Phycisphaerae bacterium]
MKKITAFCLVSSLMLATVAPAAITGSLIPNSISPEQSPGETRTYTLGYSVEVSDGPGKADVLFLTDTTETMGGYISGIKTAFGDILSTIDAELPGLDIKYGVAEYKNYKDGGNYTGYGVNLRQPLTNDTAAVQSAIDSMYAIGGHDLPESQLKAMVSLANNWMTPSGDLGFSGRADAQKIVIWAGDIEGHYFGEGGDGPADYYPSLPETLAALNARGILMFGLNTRGEGAGIDTDYGGDNQATYLTGGTGGRLFNNISSAGAEIQATIVNAVTVGVEVLSNITLALRSDSYFLVDPTSQTLTGAWTPAESPVSGSFDFDITSSMDPGFVDFDMVLLGNGAELDLTSLHLTTVPEPGTLLLLALCSLGLMRADRN